MFKRLFKRLSQDETDRRALTIRAWAETVSGVTLIADARSRNVVCIAGVVEGLTVRSREGVPAFEAKVSDGTGSITAVWLGRRTIPGVTFGARVVLTGRLGGEPSRMQLMNPTFEFSPQER